MRETEFNRLIVPLRDAMFRYARSLLLDTVEAEDLTHDVLERLWRERAELDRCRNIAAFAMRAVRNGCFDRMRQRQAVQRRNEAVGFWAERSTTDDMDRREARDLVQRAMGILPERQREALHLKDIAGYPTAEIAEILACDEAQVRTLLSRARRTLGETIKKMMNE